MKYRDWLTQELDLMDQNNLAMVSVPIQSLEALLENIQSLEGYVRYLTNNNEYLSKAIKHYRDTADQLRDNKQNKGENNGSQDS